MKCNDNDASVAQWQSGRLLSGGLQVQVLPGALKVLEPRESEDEMERLISLFRDPDYESRPQLNEQRPPPAAREAEEPLYFKQLLEYLRERKQNASALDDELIGV